MFYQLINESIVSRTSHRRQKIKLLQLNKKNSLLVKVSVPYYFGANQTRPNFTCPSLLKTSSSNLRTSLFQRIIVKKLHIHNFLIKIFDNLGHVDHCLFVCDEFIFSIFSQLKLLESKHSAHFFLKASLINSSIKQLLSSKLNR